MIRFIFFLGIILLLTACKKSQLRHASFPDANHIQTQQMSMDQDDDDIPDMFEIDKTRRIIQVPKLHLGPNTSADLTFFLEDGQAHTRANATTSIIEAPILLLDLMAKAMGKGREVTGDFFLKMGAMENCWLTKDLFHPHNIPDESHKILRVSIDLHPEVLLEEVPELHNVTGFKLKAFSIGEEGDVAYLDPSLRWVNSFGEDIKWPSLTNRAGNKSGSINMQFDRGHGLEFLLGRKRQLGLCIDDFSYEIHNKTRTLTQTIKKAKQHGVALNYSNGFKFRKMYYVEDSNLAELFSSIGKDYELTSDGQFVLDSHVHRPVDTNNLENFRDENLQNGPWISSTAMPIEQMASQSSVEQLSAFLEAGFASGTEVGIFAVPIYKILQGVYAPVNLMMESDDVIKLPKLAPGGDFDLILSAKESIPVPAELKVISVESCVNMGRNRWNKNQDQDQDCGDDYRGWCGVYHRDLIYLNNAKALSADILDTTIVIIGERRFPLKSFLDDRFTFLDRLGRIHFRMKSPLTLSAMTWELPLLSKEHQVTFGFEGFENCDHRKLGRNFRFLNYAGVVNGNQKSRITWQLQSQ